MLSVKRTLLVLLAAIFTVVFFSATAYAARRTITFKNDTGKAVNDLHIKFKQGVTAQTNMMGNYGVFQDMTGVDGANSQGFENGTVPANGSTTIKFKSTSPKINIKSWYWTIDGKQEGTTKGEKEVANISFDHEVIAIGEVATIELFAAASFDQSAFFQISYTMTTPDGDTVDMDPIEVSVDAAQELHQQIWLSPLEQVGVYTIDYVTVNVETGEVVDDGSSSVSVDTGRIPLRDPEKEEPREF